MAPDVETAYGFADCHPERPLGQAPAILDMTMASQTVHELRDVIRARIPPLPPGAPQPAERIADVVTMIAEAFAPERIVLFGSHAYGTPTKDSDLDLMVVMETPGRPVEKAVRIRQAVGRRHRFPMDILVHRPDQIRLGLEERDFFIRDVMTKGITLFEADDVALDREG